MNKIYLIIYNAVSAIGWLIVLALTLEQAFQKKSPQDLFKHVELPLKIIQTLAVMEILHSVFRLVRSPVVTVVIQVFSRLFLLWGVTNMSSKSKEHWSLYAMVLSWSLVEVPRYTFYAVSQLMPKVPFPLFWLRYTLFFALYPSGITGEVLQIIQFMSELKAQNSMLVWYLFFIIICLYVPGSPFMYFHMVTQRSNAFAAYFARPPAPPNGIEFPVTNKETLERATTETNKEVWAASVKGINDAEAKKL
jgi:very-long-chain (3R)-3-hydroxyacyl-CoA dehydratase